MLSPKLFSRLEDQSLPYSNAQIAFSIQLHGDRQLNFHLRPLRGKSCQIPRPWWWYGDNDEPSIVRYYNPTISDPKIPESAVHLEIDFDSSVCGPFAYLKSL